jgi:hypothetical protein
LDFLAILTAFGVGSAVTALIQYVLTSRAATKRRTYDERKEAYLGLVESWVKQQQTGVSSDNELDVGHWLLRCQFVAPAKMMPLLQKWADTAPGTTERIQVTDHLKAEMRNDLSNFR